MNKKVCETFCSVANDSEWFNNFLHSNIVILLFVGLDFFIIILTPLWHIKSQVVTNQSNCRERFNLFLKIRFSCGSVIFMCFNLGGSIIEGSCWQQRHVGVPQGMYEYGTRQKNRKYGGNLVARPLGRNLLWIENRSLRIRRVGGVVVES